MADEMICNARGSFEEEALSFVSVAFPSSIFSTMVVYLDKQTTVFSNRFIEDVRTYLGAHRKKSENESTSH